MPSYSNRWNEAPNHSESIGLPIFTVKQLSNLVNHWDKIEGLSVYHGILIVWPESGSDDRLLMLIDQEWVGKGIKPLAVRYSKGGIAVLWQDGLYGRAGSRESRFDYSVPDGDVWGATHFYLTGNEVRELGPVAEDDIAIYPEGTLTHGFAELNKEPNVLT